MKKQNGERLTELLGDIDESLLAKARATDTPERLKKRVAEEKKRGAFFRYRPIFIAAACLVLVVGIVIVATVPLELPKERPNKNKGTTGGSDDRVPGFTLPSILPPWESEGFDGVDIESLDMLNYYSAMRVLGDGDAQLSVSLSPDGTRLLSATAAADKGEDGGVRIYYYEFDPGELFTIAKASFCQIELKDEQGFLASKIGVGVVDVVITENSLEPMITFKNGDRYFSCIADGAGINSMNFSPLKYIDGFYLVKNLEQANYKFDVSFEGDEISGVKCSYFSGASGDSVGAVQADIIEFLEESCNASSVKGSFTIDDLEEYFGVQTLPEGN